jgi:hypothetical protein
VNTIPQTIACQKITIIMKWANSLERCKLLLTQKELKIWQGTGGSNPSYLGGRNQEDRGSRLAQVNSS